MAKTPPHRFTPGRAFGLTAALAAAIVLVVYLLLPIIAERFVLPRIMAAAGIRNFALPVQRLGIFGMRAGPLRIGPEEAPGIAVASLSAAYTPLDLLRGRIAAVTLAGVRILLKEGGNAGFAIPGLPRAAPPAEGPSPGPPAPPPVTVAALHVTQGMVIVQREKRRLQLPFDAAVKTGEAMAVLDGSLELAFADRWITVNARIDLGTNRIAADWATDDIPTAMLGRLAGLSPWPPVSGSGRTHGRLQGRLSPFAIDDLDAVFRHTPCRLYWDANRLDLSGETGREAIEVRIRSTDTARWAVATSPALARLAGGQEGRFAMAGVLGNLPEGGLEWQGRLEASLALDALGEDLPGVRLPLALATTARLETDGRWRASLRQSPDDDAAEASAGDETPATIRLTPTLFEASAEGRGRSFEVQWQWRFPDITAAASGMQVAVGAMEGTGHYRVQASGGEGSLALTLAPVTVRGEHFRARLRRVSFEAEGTLDPGAPPEIEGRLAASGGQMHLAAPAVSADGFRASLPLVWPPSSKGPAGAFSLASLEWQGMALGSLDGRLRQVRDRLDFTLRHTSRFVPGLAVAAEGRAGMAAKTRVPVATVRWTAERSAEAATLKLSALMPKPPEVPITYSGRLYAQGALAYDAGLTGSLTAGIEDGRLQVDEKGLVIEGLQTGLRIPDIGVWRSAPAQKLSFDAASFGALRVEDGLLGYQLEPERIFFLEGGRFRWCGGSVIAPATRFRPGENRYDLTVFCDRLKLDQLLEQLGMARAEGGGAISGLIPVALEDGLVTFDNAFLYSTPGEGGVIRVQGSEVLTAGIPPGTPQYNQVELARYALKDYDYDWAKITMNTVAENLLVQLQFDGKPAEPLPFTYDAETGGFVKTGPDQPGSVFQGIRLDVNVTLPLNRMLRYRELFKRLQ